MTCGRVLDEAPNGALMEAAARAHKRALGCKNVYLGYRVGALNER